MTKILILHFIAFAIGGIPFGYLIGKLKGIDIRKHGSGNTGATNVIRILGKIPGYLTLIADVSKGLLVVLIASSLAPATGVLAGNSFAASMGLFTILGHCFSPFMKFGGGKGVATGLGVFLILTPLSALVAVGVFIISLKKFGYVSLASILAAFTIPISYALLETTNGMTMTAAVISACVIASRHKQNIHRIKEGTEPKYLSLL